MAGREGVDCSQAGLFFAVPSACVRKPFLYSRSLCRFPALISGVLCFDGSIRNLMSSSLSLLSDFSDPRHGFCPRVENDPALE